MRQYDFAKPIGLKAPCAEIENTCREAHLYKRCGLRPKHLIVPLNPGSGRTTLVEYMTDQYRQAGILSFASGLDDHIEVVFDGTLPQLKQAFAAIESAAVYTNEYHSIITMDISGIASHLGEIQLTEFMKNCKQVCGHACVVFFVRAEPSKNEEKLLDKLCKTVGNIKRLAVEPYSKEELCALILKAVSEHGILVRHEAMFCAVLEEMVSAFRVSGVKEATAAADALVHFADFSGFAPVVDENSLKAMIASRQETAERGEVK